MITENEKKVLKLLLFAFGEMYSINRIAKECGLSPNGAFKMLIKFENEGIIKSQNIGNMKSYKLDFESEKTKNILKLAIISELKGKVKFRADDLKSLKQITEVCILFGSYIDLKKEPNDLDLFFVIKDKNFKEYKKQTSLIFKTMPIKVHDVLQTEEDVVANLKKKDKVVIEILKTGIILWGFDKVIEMVEHGYQENP